MMRKSAAAWLRPVLRWVVVSGGESAGFDSGSAGWGVSGAVLDGLPCSWFRYCFPRPRAANR
jgi:hypothetical protein